MLNQRTVAKTISITGIGIHSGNKVTLRIHPALADSGITFQRVDLPNAPVVKANFETVSATMNATTIGTGKYQIHTIEHLLAVLYGFGIDNVFCEIDGPEVPIMDGSGASFAFIIKETGITTLPKAKNFIVVTESVEVSLEDKWARIEPSVNLKISSTIDFPHPKIKVQTKEFEFSCESFMKEISRARTFGFLRDVDMLKRKGLAKGGSLQNAVILDEFNVINPEGLRFQDEFVRHKILDTIGDLSLLGHEIAGKVTTYRSGHHIHNLLCRKIIATPSAYKIIPSTQLSSACLSAFELPSDVLPIYL